MVLAAVVPAVVLSACGPSIPHSARTAPSLSVVTALFPLAEAARLIGGDKVHVEDVVPVGTDPLTYRPGPAQQAALRSAGLVLEIGGGFQPAVESATTAAGHVTRLRAAVDSSDPYVWLDPPTMGRAVSVIAAAMESADPAAAPVYRQNTTGVLAQISSLSGDFSSTLSACPGTLVVTPDGAFEQLAADYGLQDRIVAARPSTSAVSSLVDAIRSTSAAAVVSEPWVDDSGVRAVAAAAHVPLHTLDTLAGPPPGGWPRGGSYSALMEQDLATLSSALGCTPEGQ